MIARSGAAMLPARKSESLLLLVTLCAGAGWIFSKEALGALPPVFFIAVRFLAGGLLLGLAVPAADRREWRRSLWPAFAIGSLICGSMMCWIVALHLTTALGVGAFLTCLGPLLVPFAGWLLFRQALSKRIGLAMLLALPGIALLVGNSFLQWRFEAGQFWFFGAAAIFAFYFSLNNRFATDHPVVLFAAMQMIAVGLLALPVSLWLEPWPGELNAAGWTWLALSILIPTCLRFFLQNYAQRLAYTTNGGLIMLMEPVWAAIFSALWYGEVMTLSQVGGALLILLALMVARERHVSA